MANRIIVASLVDGNSYLTPKQLIPEDTREQVRQALLERVSLEGICRIFSISMTWLLQFINEVIADLPDDLNATVTAEGEELEVAVFELDEQWSFVGNKKNQQWLWLVFHSATRQIVAMHVGKESGKTSYIERFNNTLRQRCPRLVRKTLSFSKKLANHVGIIKHFICDYNSQRALPV